MFHCSMRRSSDGPDLKNILYIQMPKTVLLPLVLFVYNLVTLHCFTSSHAFTHLCFSCVAQEKHHVAINTSQAVSGGDGE